MFRTGDVLGWAKNLLSSKGVSNAHMESLWILSHQLGISSSELLIRSNKTIEKSELKSFKELVFARARRIPLAYILGSQEFMGLDFFVNRSVLIPRPETEILVEEVIHRVFNLGHPRILDVGTGSGNIAVVLAKKMCSPEIFATDVSSKALAVAEKNARFHGVDKNIIFLRHDLFPSNNLWKFDAVVSNPPYVCEDESNELQDEIRFEPRRALFGGRNGLKVIRRLINRSQNVLMDHGQLFMEVGHDQSRQVKEIMKSAGFSKVEAVKDPAGIDRVIIGSVHG